MINYPLSLYRGDSFSVRFELWTDPDKTQPFDLTGMTASAEIRRGSGDANATPLVCTIAGNAVDVALDAAASRALPSSGKWDLQLMGTSGVQTIVNGSVVVQGDITGAGVSR